MTDRPHDARREPAQGIDDPTRDIRLPPMAERPAAAVPAAWAGPVHTPEQAPAEEPTDHHATVDPAEPGAPAGARIADQPTDELGNPSAAVRQRTLAFPPPSPPAGSATAAASAPHEVAPVRPAPPLRRRSTWPWALAVLVLLVLFAAAVVLAWVGGEQDDLQSFWEAGAPLGHRPGQSGTAPPTSGW